MSFFAHMRRSGWEIICSVLASACVGVCLASGFFVPAELEGRFLPALLICLGLNGFAYGFSYSKKTAAVGIGALVLALVCSALALHRGAGETAIYAVVVSSAALAGFFLTRTRIGSLLALPLGALVITGEMLFQYGSHPVLLALFLLASGCLALSRIYRVGMLRSSTRRAAVSAHALLSLSACVLALLLAAGMYFAVVRPLSPPTYDIRLKTELQRLPLLEKLGVASTIHLPDPDKRTDEVHDSDLLADMNGEQNEPFEPPEPPEGKKDVEDRTEPSPSSAPADAIRYFARSRTWLYAAAIIVLAVLAVVLGRLGTRRGRLRHIRNLPGVEQVTELYPLVLNALVRCGLPPLNAESPMEYCESFGTRIQQFLCGSADFAELTKVFERAFYGGISPKEDECAEYLDLYRQLPTLCRKNVGLLRYAVVFFQV